ncbi:MAG: hypothetical protein LCH74_02085 [Proteobacteria bacterium]|nr:hypothetical protein [Pseudomonadota bacterium]
MRLSSEAGLEILVGLLPLALVGWVIFELLGGMGASIAGIALLPTLASLALVWLFFAGRLVMKLIRLRAGGGGASDAAASKASDASAGMQVFDADAALANYMRGRDAASESAIALDAVKEDGRHTRPAGGFGRKIV